MKDSAGKIRFKRISISPPVYVLRLDRGIEVMGAVSDFVAHEKIKGGCITALGAVENATIGYFLPDKKVYSKRDVKHVVEFVGATGTIAWLGDKPAPHIHAVLSGEDGAVVAGHLFSATVAVMVEVTIIASDMKLERKVSSDLGLPLLEI